MRDKHSFFVTMVSKQPEEQWTKALDGILAMKLIGKREYKQLLKRIKDECISNSGEQSK